MPEKTDETNQTPAKDATQDDSQDSSRSGGVSGQSSSPSSAMQLPTKEQFFEILMPVEDPEIRISIVDLGLIYDVLVEEDNTVIVKMTLTTPACPYGEMLINQVQETITNVEGVKEAKVELVWEPIWDPREMASDYAKDQLGIW
jgi:metal-sulfur cluster biosynthetic enzyme